MSTHGPSERDYSEKSFWEKIASYAGDAGWEVTKLGLKMYYAASKPNTPIWAKTAIYGALAYFISPVDAIPDIIPFVGYSDDLLTLTAAVAVVAEFIDENDDRRAEAQLRSIFG